MIVDMKQARILLIHNILWSKYKGGVFSSLFPLALSEGINFEIVQIAETDSDRVGLSGIDLSYHNYPFDLLFQGAYSSVPRFQLSSTLFKLVWKDTSELVLLPGFHTIEFWVMLLSAKLRGKVVGVFCDSTEYDRPRSKAKGFFKRIFFSQCDVFFGYGRRSHDYLIMFGANPKHIYFRCQAAALPHDYDISTVRQRRMVSAASPSSPRFLYVGRLAPEKGLDTQLRAFALVLRKMPAAKLVLVGTGPSKADLQALTAQLGLSNSVDFAGSKDVDALREEYLNASCCVLPSTSEPWGLVVNEALAYGCPVVVSHRCGCVPELVIDGVTGFVFEASDVVDLANKMLKVVAEFSATLDVANKCLAVISSFSPESAALQILVGCKVTLARLRPNA